MASAQNQYEYLPAPKIVLDDLHKLNPTLVRPWTVLALPDGGAFLRNRIENISKAVLVDHMGKTVKILLNDEKSGVSGFILKGQNVLILQKNGKITEMNPNSVKVLNVWYADVCNVEGGIAEGNSNLLLIDKSLGRVVRFNLRDSSTVVVASGLKLPRAIARCVVMDKDYYIVVDRDANAVNIYDKEWNLKTLIGGKESSKDGKFNWPNGVTVLPSQNFLISDFGNKRISEFNIQGEFLRHVINKRHGLESPGNLSYSNNKLWVVQGTYDPYKVKVYELFH